MWEACCWAGQFARRPSGKRLLMRSIGGLVFPVAGDYILRPFVRHADVPDLDDTAVRGLDVGLAQQGEPVACLNLNQARSVYRCETK